MLKSYGAWRRSRPRCGDGTNLSKLGCFELEEELSQALPVVAYDQKEASCIVSTRDSGRGE